MPVVGSPVTPPLGSRGDSGSETMQKKLYSLRKDLSELLKRSLVDSPQQSSRSVLSQGDTHPVGSQSPSPIYPAKPSFELVAEGTDPLGGSAVDGDSNDKIALDLGAVHLDVTEESSLPLSIDVGSVTAKLTEIATSYDAKLDELRGIKPPGQKPGQNKTLAEIGEQFKGEIQTLEAECRAVIKELSEKGQEGFKAKDQGQLKEDRAALMKDTAKSATEEGQKALRAMDLKLAKFEEYKTKQEDILKKQHDPIFSEYKQLMREKTEAFDAVFVACPEAITDEMGEAFVARTLDDFDVCGIDRRFPTVDVGDDLHPLYEGIKEKGLIGDSQCENLSAFLFSSRIDLVEVQFGTKEKDSKVFTSESRDQKKLGKVNVPEMIDVALPHHGDKYTDVKQMKEKGKLGKGSYGSVTLAEGASGEKGTVRKKVTGEAGLLESVREAQKELVMSGGGGKAVRVYDSPKKGSDQKVVFDQPLVRDDFVYTEETTFSLFALLQGMGSIGGEEYSESAAKRMLVQILLQLDPRFDHKDIKPDNLMGHLDLILNKKGEEHVLGLVDNGLAKIRGDNTGIVDGIKMKGDLATTQDGAIAGTPEYISSTVLLGKEDSNQDVWASACVIYELISGLPPFEGETLEKLFENIVDYQTEVPISFIDDDGEEQDWLTGGLKEIVLGALGRTPEFNGGPLSVDLDQPLPKPGEEDRAFQDLRGIFAGNDKVLGVINDFDRQEFSKAFELDELEARATFKKMDSVDQGEYTSEDDYVAQYRSFYEGTALKIELAGQIQDAIRSDFTREKLLERPSLQTYVEAAAHVHPNYRVESKHLEGVLPAPSLVVESDKGVVAGAGASAGVDIADPDLEGAEKKAPLQAWGDGDHQSIAKALERSKPVDQTRTPLQERAAAKRAGRTHFGAINMERLQQFREGLQTTSAGQVFETVKGSVRRVASATAATAKFVSRSASPALKSMRDAASPAAKRTFERLNVVVDQISSNVSSALNSPRTPGLFSPSTNRSLFLGTVTRAFSGRPSTRDLGEGSGTPLTPSHFRRDLGNVGGWMGSPVSPTLSRDRGSFPGNLSLEDA